MSFSEFNIKYTPNVKKGSYNIRQQNNDEFFLTQEIDKRKDPFKDYDIRTTYTKGIFCENESDEVTKVFFSTVNIKRVQKMLRKEIYNRTNKEFALDVDQDENDLLIAMRAVFFDENGAQFQKERVNHQVKILNTKVVNTIVPDMISALKQQYEYLKEINRPLQPMARPINVNNAGRRTLPSVTTLFDV
jgi:hypothetical protein